MRELSVKSAVASRDKMQVINIDKIRGREIRTPGMIRTVKEILVTEQATAHVGIVACHQRTSEHSHELSEEIVYVARGRGEVKAGGEARAYSANHLVFIPKGVRHQYWNTGEEDLVLFVLYSPPAKLPKK